MSAYSKAVQKYVEKNGFSVVQNLVGHGVGRELHENPQIPNYYDKKYQDFELKAGMTLALEPMVNVGGFETILGHNGWVFKTKDGSLSAHYENTILITEKGIEVLTIL
jgi:methionyl aminopeptidase